MWVKKGNWSAKLSTCRQTTEKNVGVAFGVGTLRLLECWSASLVGMLERFACWNVGALDCVYVAMLIRIPTFQHSNIPTFQHSNIPTFQHSNIPTFQHSNIPTFQHSNHRRWRGRHSNAKGTKAHYHLANTHPVPVPTDSDTESED